MQAEEAAQGAGDTYKASRCGRHGFQMQGGKNWILPKKINANRFL
jgi:hypothetical protein